MTKPYFFTVLHKLRPAVKCREFIAVKIYHKKSIKVWSLNWLTFRLLLPNPAVYEKECIKKHSFKQREKELMPTYVRQRQELSKQNRWRKCNLDKNLI